MVTQIRTCYAVGHRTVDVQWKFWNAVRIFQLADDVHDGLRAVHGKRRDHDHSAALCDAIDDVRQGILGRIGRVIAISIGRLTEQHIAARPEQILWFIRGKGPPEGGPEGSGGFTC